MAEPGSQPRRHARYLRRLRGPHGVWRRVAHPVQRQERRLAGKRPAAGRHHDRVRRPHGGDSHRRLRHLRRRDAQRVPAPAHRGHVRRRADGRLGRELGLGHRQCRDREQLRRREGRPDHARPVGLVRRRTFLRRVPPSRRRRGTERAHPRDQPPGIGPAPCVRHRRLRRGRQPVGRVPRLRPVPTAAGLRQRLAERRRRLRRVVRHGAGGGALRGRRRAARQHTADQERRARHRRRVRQLDLGQLLVQPRCAQHPDRKPVARAQQLVPPFGPARLLGRRQRLVRRPALRAQGHGPGPVRRRGRHRPGGRRRSASSRRW